MKPAFGAVFFAGLAFSASALFAGNPIRVVLICSTGDEVNHAGQLPEAGRCPAVFAGIMLCVL